MDPVEPVAPTALTTPRRTLVLVDPTASDRVIRWLVIPGLVGVPLMTPVVELRDRPAGSDGETVIVLDFSARNATGEAEKG